ncbi:sensor domain-containing protein [Mycobacterium interjectum]|uniref:sensor domain-containing protein n=1 Tax=Mycobacterium interjectum TaxID=33895 RepID=UPI000AA8B70F|nr:sensor domain-containing protein [Mycobacterium interjectum]MCV7091350.1 sensor domain-containing protein [Mycobacterium interjectum]
MRKPWLLVVPLTVMLFVAGCAVTVGGTAQSAPSRPPRPLSGETVDHVLLSDRTLSRIVKQALKIDPRFPPRFGGAEELADDATALPDDCVGVAAMLQQSVYGSGSVKDVAVETWRHAAASADVTSVQEGVVGLPTAEDAEAMFVAFSRQWHSCDGRTTSLPGSMFRLKGKISNVESSASVVAATVSVGWTSGGPEHKSEPHSDWESIPAGRAIGVRGNCLIEVEVDVFHSSTALGRGSGDTANFDGTAVDVARAMMDKIGALI